MEALASGYGLIEGPLWDPAKGLYFSDVPNGGISLLDRAGKISVAVPKRRGVGGMALHADGGLIFGGRDISYIDLKGGESRVLLSSADVPGAIGFNDLTTDRQGRVYVGSLAFRVFGGETPKPGGLHVIDLDGSVRTISDGVMLTNGLGFSPDGRRLYHSDSRSELVRVYDVADDGSVGPWRTFAKFEPGGVPDGLKVASDGSVWVADARGGRVAVFEGDGRHRMNVDAPLPMVTSVCFGGDDLRDLYVVTGSDRGPSDACACVFRTRVDTPGLALAPARVRV
ncbi:MAG: SMP-30/gluconolactonase/LRE family protein [Caulobacterales bacterium]